MNNTAERNPFAPSEFQRGSETHTKNTKRKRLFGAHAVSSFLTGLKETFVPKKEVRQTPAQRFQGFADGLRQQNPHGQEASQGARAQEKAFPSMKGRLDTGPNYGVGANAVYERTTPKAFASMKGELTPEPEAPAPKNPTVEGTVSLTETSVDQPVAQFSQTEVGTGRDTYGRHDSGETRESTEVGAHYKEGTLMSERNLALQNVPSKQFETMEGTLDEEPYQPHSYEDESEIIGTDAWHKAQQKQPEYNPNEVSIGASGEIPVTSWLKGDEAKAFVQEQPLAARKIPEHPLENTEATPDQSNDETWEARRRERLIRMQNSVKPGEYRPDVIGAQTEEESQDRKAA